MLKDMLPKIITDTLPGEKSKAVIEKRSQAVPEAIKCPYPCVIKRGEGAVFEDLDGNIFLDWVGGVGVLNIGYSHPELICAVKEQSEKYFHAMMNIVTHSGYVKLAEKMNEIVPTKGEVRKTMFANSGAEADENAVKIAKAYTGRPNIIVFFRCLSRKNDAYDGDDLEESLCNRNGSVPGRSIPCGVPLPLPCA